MLYTKMNVTRCKLNKDNVDYIVFIIEKEGTLDFYIQGSKFNENLYYACYVPNDKKVESFDEFINENIDSWIDEIERRENINYKKTNSKKDRLYL